jgi:DegV family protein with EDD domain
MTVLTPDTTCIVLDSTCDPQPAFRGRPGFFVVPLKVFFGNEVYEDGIDLTIDQFYEKLAASTELPTSSQPTEAEFESCYTEACQRYEHVFSLHISEEMSGTVRAARMAAERFPRVEVYDSRTVSAGCGIVAERLWARIQEGVEIEAARAFLRDAAQNARLVVHGTTLEYLRRGGRIGRAQSLVGGVLGIHPILHTADGFISAYGKARGDRKAVDMMMQFVRENAPADRTLHVAIIQGGVPEVIPLLSERILAERPNAQIALAGPIGSVIGVHIGPGPSAIGMLSE